jgi:hypothetical protein
MKDLQLSQVMLHTLFYLVSVKKLLLGQQSKVSHFLSLYFYLIVAGNFIRGNIYSVSAQVKKDIISFLNYINLTSILPLNYTLVHCIHL